MKKYLVIGLLTIIGCTSSKTENNEPAPLQEHSNFGFSKRGAGGDIVSELYEDLAEKDPQLKQLENSIDQLNDQKADSTKQFHNYDDKNRSYYAGANIHLRNISDSALRQKLRLQIEKSLSVYEQTVASHQSIMDEVTLKTQNLNDLHKVLKIVKTLPVIANYQQNNLPATKPLSFINKNYDAVLKQIDALISKQKL